MVEVSIIASALAGAGSFFSPCILPILPAFISYISGTTLNEIKGEANGDDGRSSNSSSHSSSYAAATQPVTIKKATRLNIFLNTAYFVLGFSLVFAVLGVVFNSILSSIGTGFQSTITSIGGIVIIVFGAYIILSTKLRFLNFEKKMTSVPRFKTSYITSFAFGATFAAGWTPCVGPILGSTFALAATAPGAAYNSLLAYSLGLGVPFLITGAFFSRATTLIRKMVKYLRFFNPIMGGILIVLGILVYTGQLSVIGNFPLADQFINLERGL